MFLKENRQSLSWKAKHLLLALGIGACSMLQGTMAFAAGDGDGAEGISYSDSIIVRPTTPSSNNVVTLTNNRYTINDESVSYGGNFQEFDGGYSTSGNASNNNVTVKGGTVTKYLNGGFSYGIGDTNNNTVVVNDGTFGEWVEGGWATRGNALNNSVTINGGTFNGIVDGGYTEYGNANDNTVIINGGTFNTGNVTIGENGIYGGYVNRSGNANGNKTNITAGTINSNVYGGYTASGESSDNKVNISGNPVINGEVYGGWAESGKVTNNSINIEGSPNLTNATLVAGRIGSTGTSSGNSLNIYTKDLTAKNISGFQDLNYYLPSNISNGDKILTLTDTNGTDLSNTRVNIAAWGDANFSVGDTFTLLQNDNGITVSNVTKSGILPKGISRDYALTFSGMEGKGATEIKAIVGETLTDGLKPQTEAIAQSALPAISLIHVGSDRILHWLPPEEGLPGEDEKEDIESEMIEPTNEFKMFANMDFSSLRTKTGNGSYVDSRTGGMDLGWARSIENSSGTSRLIFAPVIDYGKGDYDSYLGNGIHGHGKMNYLAGGMIARKMFANGFYYEGSFRIGRAKADFTSDDFMRGDVPTTVSYDTSTPIWAGHINIGKFYKLSNRDTVQVYAHYFHSHQNGMHTTLSTGERYEFDSIDSGRFRAGIHLTRQVNKKSRFYSGLAYQYEFSGDSRGTYDGSKTPSSKIKGSSGMIELGYQLKPSERVPWMIDAGLVGWIGHQKGLSFQVKVKKSF